MRIEEIIENAKAALARYRAELAENHQQERARIRQQNRNAWEKIVASLLPEIPAELHDCISFDEDTNPVVHEEDGRSYWPIRIDLPVPEKYVVFGYSSLKDTPESNEYKGFLPADPLHDWAPFPLSKYQIVTLGGFEIALGEAVEIYTRHRSAQEEKQPAPEVERQPTRAERLVALIEEMVTEKVADMMEVR